MHEVLRLTDSDESRLAQRVAAAMAGLGAGLVVSTFTYWYTARAPVHEAVVLREG